MDNSKGYYNVADENRAIQKLFEDETCGKGDNGIDQLADHCKLSHSQLSIQKSHYRLRSIEKGLAARIADVDSESNDSDEESVHRRVGGDAMAQHALINSDEESDDA